MSQTPNGVVPHAGPDLPAPATGLDHARALVGSFEADLALAARQRSLAAARTRLRAINDEFARLAAEAASEPEVELARIFVRGSRRELLECYLTVGGTEADRAAIAAQVDGLIDKTLDRLARRDPPADPPAAGGAGSGKGRKAPPGRGAGG